MDSRTLFRCGFFAALLLSVYPFRQERIGWRKLAGVALVVPGVVLISLRTP